MSVFITILIVLFVLGYLALGFVIAKALAMNSIDGMKWWQGVLIMLLWPFIPFLFLLAAIGWIKDGSH